MYLKIYVRDMYSFKANEARVTSKMGNFPFYTSGTLV